MSNSKTVLLAVLATVLVTLGVLYLLGDLLLVFGLSGVIAYTLLPLVKLIERIIPWRERKPGLARTIAVLIMFLLVLAIVAGVLFLIVPPTIRETNRFIQEFPQLFSNARLSVEEWVAAYSNRIPEQIREQLEGAAANAGNIVFDSVRNLLQRTIGVVSSTFSLVVGFAIAPILIFYLMKDSGSIQSGLIALFPPSLRPHIQNILDIANDTLGAYIRGQLTLGLIVGTIVAVGLLLLGVPFAFLLGIVAGFTELIPFIGPWIGGAVGVLVTLATAPDKLLWVVLLYVGVQLLENTVLVPRVQGHSLNLHPAVVLLIITFASQIWGIWGIILGPPVAALIKDLTVYFAQQWSLASQPRGAAVKSGAAEPSIPTDSEHPPGNKAPDGEEADG
jgi:predicted PurR-regulated permease PerM